MQVSQVNPRIVNFLDEKTWREFVDRHPQGNIFQTPEFYRVFSQTRNHRPLLYAALDDKEKVLALLTTTLVTLWDGLLYRLTTRSISYGGVLCETGSSSQSALRTLLNAYSNSADRKILFTELRNLSDTGDIQPVLTQCGFAYEEHLNYLIDLNCSSEELIQRIGSRTRHNIRRGLRKGNVIIEQVSDREQLPTWYNILRQTYKDAHVPLADYSLFTAAFDTLHPRGMIQYWLARVGPVYVAASAELLYKDVIYGWYGGVDRVYAREVPGELMMWHILDWGVTNGYKIYDFGGAGKPGEVYGVRDFKAKFGGKLVCFGRNTKIHSPKLLKLSAQGCKIYQKLIAHF